jgi:F-type H+-transporting ATPase subunit b
MEIILPQLGLFIWTTLLFLVFFVILRTVAWKPIMSALKSREEGIATSLSQAAKAREEIEALKSQMKSDKDVAERERAVILREAKEMGDEIIAEAKKQAEVVNAREIEKAKAQINSEKMAALTEIKNQIGTLAIEIAEQILRAQLADRSTQEALANKLVAELSKN